MTRRLLPGLMALVLACFALVACTQGSAADGKALAGTWELDSMEGKGSTTTSEDLAALKDTVGGVYLVLSEDGTAEFEMFGITTSGTWKATGANAGKVTMDSGSSEVSAQEQSMTLEGDKLVLKSSTDTLRFERIDPAERKDPPAQADASQPKEKEDAEASPQEEGDEEPQDESDE